jgi:polyisoprenoid-binding protein YceI
MGLSVNSQEKYITKTGSVVFEASVPSFEEVAAKNNSVTAIINIKTGEFAALALVKAFRFKNALMEEHFNENYAESNIYPKATFKGSIKDFTPNNLSNSFKINGELSFHGVTKTVDNIPISITEKEDKLFLSGNFILHASDFDIDVPKIVRNKIAEEIRVHFNFELIKN